MRSLSLSFLVAALALLSTACGASLGREPATLSSQGSPQAFPIELAGAERVGWVIVSHDDREVSITWVFNPGWTMSAASLCARGESFGWTDPAACERRIPAAVEGTPTITVPFAELGGVESACDRAIFLQAQADVVDESTGLAAGSAYAGTFKGRIAIVPECARETAPGCVKTAGQWLDTAEWPIDGAKLGASTYSNVEMAVLLDTDAQSDASVLLAREVIAAQLNIASGAEPAGVAGAAIDEAQSWLVKNGDANTRLPFGLKVTAEGTANLPGWDEGVNLAALAGRFSEGFAGAARCDR